MDSISRLQDELLFSHDRVNSSAADTIRSFDHFLDVMFPYIVREFSKIEIVAADTGYKHIVQFGDVVVHKPLVQDLETPQRNIRIMTNEPLLPEEARARGLTYSAEIFVNIDYSILDPATGAVIERFPYREVPLMQMPVMLRSKFCHLRDMRNMAALKECQYDQGGYFIVRGNAKVIQPQKVQRINVHIVKNGGAGQLPIDLEIRSLRADEKFRSTSTLYVHYAATAGGPPVMLIDVPFLKEGHNAVLLFRALGLTGRDDIEDFLWGHADDPRRRFFQATLASCAASDPHFTIDQVYDALGHGMYNEADLGTQDRIRRQVQQQVSGELLPHCGFDDSHATRWRKLVYLRVIVHHMLGVYLGMCEPDDRDFEGFKSVHMSATLLSTMFRQMFSAFVKTIRNKMYDRFKKSKYLDVAALVAHSDTLTRDVLKAFSEGEVTVKQASNAGSGVIQLAHQINPLGITTHLQRVSTALPKDGKYTLMRGVDATQLCSYCPAETPEGHGAGLLQNLTLFASVRLGVASQFVQATVLHRLQDYAVEQKLWAPCSGPFGIGALLEPLTDRRQFVNGTLVFVNGEPIAVSQTPEALVAICREARRDFVLPNDCSVIMAPHGVCIFSDMGTVTFPLIHLERLKAKQHVLAQPGEVFKNMLAAGIIEYIDAWELMDYRLAFTEKDLKTASEDAAVTFGFTHLALHPTAFLGTAACTVPWSDHDQAPRVSYQAGMVKQAVSTPATNLEGRLDFNYAYTLWYPQRPMADTIVSRSRKLHDWPMGENLLIAIASYEGLSQEDAIVRSRAAIERGSGRISVRRVFKAVVRRVSATDYEAFESPLDTCNGQGCIGLRAECDYTKVDRDGLPVEGTHVQNGDVLIGRVYYTTDDSGRRVRRDRSIIMTCEDAEDFVVDKVAITINRDGLRQVRIRVRTVRVPQVGDKISDRHGQKGVIGHLANQEDLPFIADGPNAGMVPDAIVNLHSINGRMTIGKLLEMLMSCLGIAEGSFVDATPFKYVSAHWAIDKLVRSGYGVETTMISGTTGEPLSQPWFVGSCFYQSLKHMVLDKIAARNRGPRAALTRQPLDGRAHQGGQRLGEMERDAFLAHGASFTLDDRSRVASDGHVAPVCLKCGQIGEVSTKFTIKGLLGADTAAADAAAEDCTIEEARAAAEEAAVQRGEACRACGGPIEHIDTTYCYSGLLIRELATVGIKVEHTFDSAANTSATSGTSATLASTLAAMSVD